MNAPALVLLAIVAGFNIGTFLVMVVLLWKVDRLERSTETDRKATARAVFTVLREEAEKKLSGLG